MKAFTLNQVSAEIRYQFTPVSSNVKTGKIPTTMTERASCPDTCPLKKSGCYADNFPLSLHWDRVAEKGMDLDSLLSILSKLNPGQLWRHNVAGDFQHILGDIVRGPFWRFVMAVAHTKPIIYSHHVLNANNTLLFRMARENGVVVNTSCESLEKAREAIDNGINAVFIGSNITKTYRDGDLRVITCPAQLKDSITCASCGLCSRDRIQKRIAIQFLPHGAKAKTVNKLIGG